MGKMARVPLTGIFKCENEDCKIIGERKEKESIRCFSNGIKSFPQKKSQRWQECISSLLRPRSPCSALLSHVGLAPLLRRGTPLLFPPVPSRISASRFYCLARDTRQTVKTMPGLPAYKSNHRPPTPRKTLPRTCSALKEVGYSLSDSAVYFLSVFARS